MPRAARAVGRAADDARLQGRRPAGLAERLDELADLGITALYLNPVFSVGLEPSLQRLRLPDGRPAARRRRGAARAARRGPRPRDPGRPRRRLQPRRPRLLAVPPRPRERAPRRRTATGSTSTRTSRRAARPRRRTRTAAATQRRDAARLPRLVGPAGAAQAPRRAPAGRASTCSASPSTGSASGSTAGGSTCPAEIEDQTFWPEFRRRCPGRQPRRLPRRRDLGRGARLAERRPVRRADELPARDGDPRLRRRRPRSTWRSIDGQSDYRAIARTPLDGPAFARRARAPARRCTTRPSPRSSTTSSAATTRRGRGPSCGGDRAALRLAMLLQLDAARRAVIYYGDELGDGGRPDPGLPAGLPGRAGRRRRSRLRAFVRAP